MIYDPNVIYQKLLETGADWADKKAAFQLLDDMTKTFLAEAVSRMEGTSQSARETLARNDSVYVAHLEGVGKARREYLHAEVKYKSMQALADARKTEKIAGMAEKKYIGMGEG